MNPSPSITPREDEFEGKRWLSMKEACRYAGGICENTLMKFRAQLKISKLPGSRLLFIDRYSLDALMEAHVQGRTDEDRKVVANIRRKRLKCVR